MMLSSLSKDQLILMTTNSAYGSGDRNNFAMKLALNPISKYAVDKVEIEKELMAHQTLLAFDWQLSLGCRRACVLTCW